MTFKELLQKARKTCQEEIKLLRDKGRDYTDGNDALENFKEAARTLGTDPWLIWAVYFRKHLRAIFSFVKNKKVHSEPIRGRFQDARNYLLLGMMLLDEAPFSAPLKNYYDGEVRMVNDVHINIAEKLNAEFKNLNSKRARKAKSRNSKRKGMVG